jgi:hypothetical protein
MRALLLLTIVSAITTSGARAAEMPPRPDPKTSKAIATCKLQLLAVQQQPKYESATTGLYSLSRPADDPLANYERTPLGDWPMPAQADRNDPWIRLLLLSRKSPVIIDIAVFIEGRPFREVREAWIDEVIADAKALQGDALSSNANRSRGNNGSKPAGTNTSDATSNGEPIPSQDGAGTEKPFSVAVQARQAPTMRERLMNHLASSEAQADRAEIGWLLAESGAGPGIVVLSPALSWQRASLSPLLDYLDEDADRTISGSELEGLEARMKLVDYNGDEVVEVNEICRATTNQRAQVSNGHSLVVRLDKNTDWTSLATTMQSLYGNRNTSSTFEEDGLLNASADIAMRIDFKSAANQQHVPSGVAVLSIREGISAAPEAVIASNDALSVDVGGDHIEFAAGQSRDQSGERSMASQIAVGAVIDGNPLLRLIDRDHDGRLTLRELQELLSLLAALDANSDGDVSGDEIPVPIRLAVTLGPHVHECLAKPTASLRSVAPRPAAVAPPDWFSSMDKNNDGDLSRTEFLGTAEQFRQFDTDEDGLLGIAEAQKLSAGQ